MYYVNRSNFIEKLPAAMQRIISVHGDFCPILHLVQMCSCVKSGVEAKMAIFVEMGIIIRYSGKAEWINKSMAIRTMKVKIPLLLDFRNLICLVLMSLTI